ncbi:MAG: DUF4382 domain-containing protein [bacterium]
MRRFNRMSIVMAGLAVLILSGLPACSDSTDPSDSGTLRVNLVDAPVPIAGVEAIEVVFSSVLVHQTSGAELGDAAWLVLLDETLSEAERTFDLLELVNGNMAVLGEIELDPGHYSQIRIIIESATITVDGQTSELFIMSGTQSGIKLVQAFDVEPDTITELTVDFDAGQSVWENPEGSGNYQMQPTLRLAAAVISGSISGTVTPTGIDVLVVAKEAGSDEVVTSTYVDPDTGEYMILPLLEGDYDLMATAEGYETAYLEGVTVSAQADNGGNDMALDPLSPGGLR